MRFFGTLARVSLRARFGVAAVAVTLLAAAWGSPSQASEVIYSGSSGSLAASADFVLTGNTLTVTLTNTSTSDVLDPSGVLTAVFFNSSHSLSPVSASLNGSTVWYANIKNNVGEGWTYKSPLSPLVHGENSGISAAGLGVFQQANFFSPPVTPLDGVDYGILSAGDNPATANGGLSGHGPLIKNSIVFTLTAASGFSLGELGNSIVFQYGTDLTEPSYSSGPPQPGPNGGVTPEPTSLLLMSLGLGGVFVYRRFRW